MEQKKSSIGKVSLSYGLIVGVLLILWSLLMHIFDIDRESYISFISYLILLGGIIWGSKIYRDNYSGGFITYGKSFSVGFLVGLFGSILVSIFFYIFLIYIDPATFAEILENALNNAELNILESNPDISDQDLEQILSMTEKFTTQFTITIGVFIMYVISSVIFSLIASIFIKKEEKLV